MSRILTLTAAATALCLYASPGWALHGDAPWCAVVNIGNGEIEWDCEYQTIEQCRPNVIAGNRGFCNHNPYYVPPAPRPPHVRHRARHSGQPH